jgi:SAM-dependent methyltransferase
LHTRAATVDWITIHRERWARKASLRAVYRRWFACLHAACVPETSIVELGCGPSFFKELYPEVLATDVMASPFADRIVDAADLPFADGEVDNFVLVDVFHHLPRPDQFLREAARTLRPGGRVAMIEPWLGVVGRLIFRYLHHEDCDPCIDPVCPYNVCGKDPMQGNAALPYLYFRMGGYLEQMGTPLHVIQRDPFAGLPWLLSGGFQPVNLIPAKLVGLAELLDRWLSRVPRLTATRCLLVLERDVSDVSVQHR